MVTLRKKIQKPFLALMVFIPITIMILFNFSLSYFAKQQAKKDLTYVASNISDGFKDENFMRIFPYVRSQLGSSTVEVIVYNKLGLPAKFLETTDSFVTREIAIKSYDLLKELPLGDIGSFSVDGDDYYIIEVDYTSRGLYDKIIYISKGLFLDGFVKTVNLLLFIISILVTFIAIIISKKVTKSIATPIEEITNSIENVKPNEILTIDTKSETIEIEKLSKEFNAMNQRIYEAHKSQKSFLQNASHELRTPLMNIQGYADGIEMGVFNDTQGTAHLISEQSKRLTKIVDSLLTLARVENFDPYTHLHPLNISDYLLSIVEEYRGYALKKNVTIQTEIQPSIYANANDELMRGAVGNILSNAIRYAQETVMITLSVEMNKILITIKDDGTGINDIDIIYERFSKGKDGNFGLGLSIAKTSIEKMNGQVTAYNHEGAVFAIELSYDN